MRGSLKRALVMGAEMDPDVYSGQDEHLPRWRVWAEGDKDEAPPDVEPLILRAENFPPGTRVWVEEPCCPECDHTPELCSCGFDWREWASLEFS